MLSQDKIEAFRKKLREGKPVRVAGGRVTMADARDEPQAETQSGERLRADEQVQGVMVKPHEWGALPFYMQEYGEKRALMEQKLLQEHYPGFEMSVDDDGTPFVHGHIGPNDKLSRAYQVLLVLPPGFGRGSMPHAYVLEPRLKEGAPHLYVDGSLCLDHSGAFTERSTLVTFLAWVSVWLVLYEGWLESGQAW